MMNKNLGCSVLLLALEEKRIKGHLLQSMIILGLHYKERVNFPSYDIQSVKSDSCVLKCFWSQDVIPEWLQLKGTWYFKLALNCTSLNLGLCSCSTLLFYLLAKRIHHNFTSFVSGMNKFNQFSGTATKKVINAKADVFWKQ